VWRGIRADGRVYTYTPHGLTVRGGTASARWLFSLCPECECEEYEQQFTMNEEYGTVDYIYGSEGVCPRERFFTPRQCGLGAGQGKYWQRLHTAVKGVSSRAPPLACKKRVSCPACEGLRVSLACVTRHRPRGRPLVHPHTARNAIAGGRECGPGHRGAREVVGQMPDSLSRDTLKAHPTSTSRHRGSAPPPDGAEGCLYQCVCIPLL